MTESTEKKTVAERAEALSEDVLESVRDRQQTVIEAMRKFVDRLDEALPDLGEERRKKVLDALVDFAEKLGTTTNDFVAKMVRSASDGAQVERPTDSTTDRQPTRTRDPHDNRGVAVPHGRRGEVGVQPPTGATVG